MRSKRTKTIKKENVKPECNMVTKIFQFKKILYEYLHAK